MLRDWMLLVNNIGAVWVVQHNCGYVESTMHCKQGNSQPVDVAKDKLSAELG